MRLLYLFFSTLQLPPRSTLFPYTTLFRSILVSNIKAWEGALAVAKPEDDGRVGSHRYLTCVPNKGVRSEEHTSELQSHHDLVCRLLLEKKNNHYIKI